MPRSKILESNSEYSLQLSRDELRWLARAFDINALPLPGVVEGNRSSQDAQKAVVKGQDSLKSRSMIHQIQGQGWQVDTLPAALVRWLAESKWKFVAQVNHKTGESNEIQGFIETASQAAMSVDLDGDNYLFVLYPDRDAFITAMHNWIDDNLQGISKTSKKSPRADSSSYQLPQPEVFIPVAWRDKKIADKILDSRFSDPRAKKTTTKWLETLEWVAILSRLNLDVNIAKLGKQTILCGTQSGMWSGGKELPKPEIVPLSPISWQAVRILIENLL